MVSSFVTKEKIDLDSDLRRKQKEKQETEATAMARKKIYQEVIENYLCEG